MMEGALLLQRNYFILAALIFSIPLGIAAQTFVSFVVLIAALWKQKATEKRPPWQLYLPPLLLTLFAC